MLCDRFGHKRLALAGLVVIAAGGPLGAAASGFVSLLLSRFLEGVGFIAFVVSAVVLMHASAGNARDARQASAYGAPTCRPAARWRCSRRRGDSAWGWRGLWVVFAIARGGGRDRACRFRRASKSARCADA